MYKQTWHQRVLDENIQSIDKRQYMRFNVDEVEYPVEFESVPQISSIINISRGGVQVATNGNVKVGDIVPVHVKYGDLDFSAQVKIVSANKNIAGGEFVNLNKATANKLLYMNLLMEDYVKAQNKNSNNISINRVIY